MLKIAKVISGGQTGVDQAALRAAKSCGIPTGGYAPKGWRTENGEARWLANYGLIESSGGYSFRTRMNIMAADWTLILTQSPEETTGGTALTVMICNQEVAKGKPYTSILLRGAPSADESPETVLERAAMLMDGFPVGGTLNVAGPRESKSTGIGAKAEAFLIELFRLLKGE